VALHSSLLVQIKSWHALVVWLGFGLACDEMLREAQHTAASERRLALGVSHLFTGLEFCCLMLMPSCYFSCFYLVIHFGYVHFVDTTKKCLKEE